MKIEWNGFLKLAVEKYPKEVCGFLYSKYPYTEKERWYVFPVTNVSDDPEFRWQPDKKEMQKIKREARKMELVRLGNVHTHPYPTHYPFLEKILQEVSQPSDVDLSYAKHFGDIVRGIIVVGKDKIYDIFFHDMYGNKIPVMVVEEER